MIKRVGNRCIISKSQHRPKKQDQFSFPGSRIYEDDELSHQRDQGNFGGFYQQFWLVSIPRPKAPPVGLAPWLRLQIF